MSLKPKDFQGALVARHELSEEQLKEALHDCASEPIHIPNLIQPHGVMIVVRAADDIIVQVSKNLNQIFDSNYDAVIGQPLSTLLPDDYLKHLNNIIRLQDLQVLRSIVVTINSVDYNAVTHITGDYKVIEFEPVETRVIGPEEGVYEDLRDFAKTLQQAHSIDQLTEIVVKQVRDVTGFARVKLYQFDEEWNGMIIAENKAPHMSSYLGLNFPASDIPEQARKLYATNYLRLISDTRYQPVKMYPERIEGEKAPLDMSYSVLRSVSPIHIQYLENINVSASMSVSIMQNGKLWGLIACHHDEALFVSYENRVIAETIGHIFSAKLSSMEQAEVQVRSAKKSLLIEKISSQINTAISANEILFGNHSIAMEALEADGLAIRTGETIHSFGHTPEEEVLEMVVNLARKNMSDQILYTRDIKTFFEDHPLPLSLDGGFLAVPIGNFSHDIAIWFREAKTKKVKWAGNPEKPLEKTKAGYRLTPRSSFELWQTETKGKCEPWSEDDISAAKSITQIILENEKLHAQQANIAKTEFLSQMSHELRTPLGAALGIIKILDKDKDLTEKQRQLIDTLNISATSLLDLINDLLDIAKIESQEIEMEISSFSLAQILEDIRSMMNVKAHEKGLALNIHYDRNDPNHYFGDTRKIRQILINLVNNALKFTHKGFVNVMANVERHSDNEAVLNFEVVDTGIGIDENKKDEIFKKFVQANTNISTQYGGTGLGLAITKKLLKLMNGRITVESNKNMGSKFSFFIPVTIDVEHEQRLLSQIENKSNKANPKEKNNKRILLVEDYEANIVVALYYFQEEGFDVVIANNGKEAIQKMEKENFDLVIMDVQMPIMDGLTATKIIREKQASKALPPTPILGMTANALREDRDKCLASGMDDYISKPLDFNELSQKMNVLMNNIN